MQRLIEAGEITPEDAEVSERRNIILQALGPEPYIKIDITHQQLRRADKLVLCSDGLSGVVRDAEMAEIVQSTDDLVSICQRLIRRANEAGGPDNITVIAARFDGEGLGAPGADDEVGHRQFPVGETTPVAPLPRVSTGEFTAPARSAAAATAAASSSVGTTTRASKAARIAAVAALLIAVVALYLYLHRH
jgi:protein phosphatase